MHSSFFNAELSVQLQAYANDDDDISVSSDDSMSSLDLDEPNAAFSPAYLFTEEISLAMYTIRFFFTTAAKHSIGSFTCQKLQQFDTWPD